MKAITVSASTAVAFFALLLAIPASEAAEQRIVLRESLRLEWKNELVSFTFTAPEGTCHPASVTLVGPRGPVPSQISGLQHWPGTSWLKEAQLSFLVDLAPLAEDAYTVRYGVEPAPRAAPAPNLRITRSNDRVEVLTGRFGARFFFGQRRYRPAVPVAEVPGPLVALQLADGTWFGGSRLFGSRKIVEHASWIAADGPVFARIESAYWDEDGRMFKTSAEVAAGDSAVLWSTWAKDHRPEKGWELLLSPGLGSIVFPVQMEFWTRRDVFLKAKAKVGDWAELPLADYPPGTITNLSPWPDWFDDFTQPTIPLKLAERKTELRINSRDSGVWVEPVAAGESRQSPSLSDKLLPLVRTERGELFLRVNAAGGERHWSVGEHGPEVRRLRPAENPENPIGPQPHGATGLQPSAAVGRRLNVVKDYVLDWPEDSSRRRPRLYLSREQLEAVRKRPAEKALLDSLRQHKAIDDVPNAGLDPPALGAYLLTGDPKLAEEMNVVERLRRHLGALGHFDKMRNVPIVTSYYDALIDSDLIVPAERRVMRARMAYLGYNLADPYTWSYERGYCSGNPNMTVSFVLNLGLVGCTIADHPAARAWTQPALAMMERWLKELGPEGEHPESVANYAHVSTYNMLAFAVAAKNAGLADYVNDPRMKRLMLFLARQYTPPDPRGGRDGQPDVSRLPPSGRGPGGLRTVLAGMMARATAESDPEYSAAQQWVWQREGYPYQMEGRLGGYEYVYADRSLSARNPEWATALFPAYGVIFRHGLGGKDEWYVNFQVHMRDGYPTTNGSFPLIFAKGAPISTAFVESYADREELLVSRVLPARRRGTPEERAACYSREEQRTIAGFSALARQDYAAVDVTIGEPRRASHMGGQGAAASLDQLSVVEMPEWPPVPAAGKPPVAWRRQVLFLKDDDPAGANYLVLRDTIGGGQPTMWQFWTLSDVIVEETRGAGFRPAGQVGNLPHELRGDRFTAIGQHGVDLEFFVAGPSNTPRHTLRCGEKYGGQTVQQDLLHLQSPGDGAYYVALFPRRRNEPPPRFEKLAGGAVIKTSGEFGADYAFLSGAETKAAEQDVAFQGTAGSVQDRKTGLVLALGAKGEVRFRGYALSADGAAGLRVGQRTLTVELSLGHAGTTLSVVAPGAWALEKSQKDVRLVTSPDGRTTLTVPKAVDRVVLAGR